MILIFILFLIAFIIAMTIESDSYNERYTGSWVFGILALVTLIATPIVSLQTIAVGEYSEGERYGTMSKVSEKGLICKTYEGYMLIGGVQDGVPEKFRFTVKDETIFNQLNDMLGKEVRVEYDQHFYTSACWGDTNYEIVNVKEI